MSDSLPTSMPDMVSDDELRDLLGFASRLADASGAVIRPYFRSVSDVQNKAAPGSFDPVTVADRGSEQAIRDLIRRELPEHGIFGEEHGYQPGSSPLVWVIDPIDGTKAFITGLPLWGTLIALYDGQKPILGVMDQPYLRERFIGSRLGAEIATAAGRRALATRACPRIEQAIVQTTHPDMFVREAEQKAFAGLSKRARLVRFGGDCYAYCMLAHGLIDLVVEADLAPYDIQALIPIVEAAGGVVTSWSGGPAAMGGQVIAAGDRELHAAAVALLSEAAV